MPIRSVNLATNSRWYQSSNATVPVGTILAYLPGYFNSINNGGFTPSAGATFSQINSKLNPMGYWVCNGAVVPAQLNSPPEYYNTAGRYLPDLTNNRFLMGSPTYGGTPGGQDSVVLINEHLPSHYHTIDHKHTGSTANATPNITFLTNKFGTGGGAKTRVLYAADAKNDTSYSCDGETHNHTVTIDDYSGSSGYTGSNWAHENKPNYLSVVFIMKVF